MKHRGLPSWGNCMETAFRNERVRKRMPDAGDLNVIPRCRRSGDRDVAVRPETFLRDDGHDLSPDVQIALNIVGSYLKFHCQDCDVKIYLS
jgi:hypothetical protein